MSDLSRSLSCLYIRETSISAKIPQRVNVEHLVDSRIEDALVQFCKNMHPIALKNEFANIVLFMVDKDGSPSPYDYYDYPDEYYVNKSFANSFFTKLFEQNL